jgi:hypothetical protein
VVGSISRKGLGLLAGMRWVATMESGRRVRVRVYRVDETGPELVAVLVSTPGDAARAVAALVELFGGVDDVALRERLRPVRPRRDRP